MGQARADMGQVKAAVDRDMAEMGQARASVA